MSTQFSRFGWSKAQNSFAPTALALAVMAGLISGCAASDASQVADPTKAVTTAPAEPQKESASPEVTEAAEEEPAQEEPELDCLGFLVLSVSSLYILDIGDCIV